MKKLNSKAIGQKARAEVKRRNAKQAERFAELYNQKKVYQFPLEVNMTKHFFFAKFIGEGKKYGSSMTPAALAIYPVMCSRADFAENKWFQISQENIAKMAGLSVTTTNKGINDLVKGSYAFVIADAKGNETNIPFLEREKATEGTRHFFRYRAGFLRAGDMIEYWKGSYIQFHTCIIDSGVWAKLNLRAKALYLAMRCNSYLDFEKYCYVEGEVPFDDQTGQYDYFPLRRWDFCEKTFVELSEFVGMSPSNLSKPIRQLEQYKLIERMGKWSKVFLRPRY